MERTLVLVKPDGVLRGLTGEIIARLERAALKLVSLKMARASRELAGKHYAADPEWMRSVGEKALEAAKKRGAPVKESAEQIGQRVRGQLIEYLTIAPVVAMVFEGNNAVLKVRSIVGATSPEHAAPGTIRGDFCTDSYALADSSKRPVQNLIHASGTVEEAERELAVWFSPTEIGNYQRTDDALIYRKG